MSSPHVEASRLTAYGVVLWSNRPATFRWVTVDLPHLPDPDSEELASLLGTGVHRLLYGLLYRRRYNPPTMVEIRFFMSNAAGEDHSQTDRRVRDLRQHFVIQVKVLDGEHRYVLVGWNSVRAAAEAVPVSNRLKAQVLQPQRCAMCGKTPLEDEVRLVVDHKVPQSWGGTNDVENLQPLCEDCNAGKRDFFATFEDYADKIRLAASHDEPQKRIGELLRAFNGAWVRTDLLAIVASAKEFQEDWQRRLRDLRFLGWDYESEKRFNEGARVWTYYRLTKSAPWPDNIAAALRLEAARRAAAKESDGGEG